MLKKEDDLMVGNEMMDKTTNRAYLASANAFAQILLRRTSDALGTLDEIFKSNLRVLRGEYAMGNLREPNAKGDRDIQSFQECCSDVWALHKV